jgi:hypothetical protein
MSKKKKKSETDISKKLSTRVEYVAVRLGFQAQAVVNGTAEVWLPLSVAGDIDCSTTLGKSLAETVLDAEAIEWYEEADLTCIDTTALMDSVELIDGEQDCYPAYRCFQNENGDWHIVESTGNDSVIVEDDDEEDDDDNN